MPREEFTHGNLGSNVIRLEAEKEEDAYIKPRRKKDTSKNEDNTATKNKADEREPQQFISKDGELFCKAEELKKNFLEKLNTSTITGGNENKTTEELCREKKNWTDEERRELQKKLDNEFDEFIQGLEKRQTSEAWPEDKWEEEMEKHPFFMKNIPEDGPLPPMLEGLCQLKYSSTDNTPEELAVSFKDDGNFNFKCKNYRMSIISYTEGIGQRCNDNKLNAQLYNNRAAAHFYLKNYRSCFNDCKRALKEQPHYPKASFRLAQVSLELGEIEECLQECEILLSSDPTNKEYKEFNDKALQFKKIKERNERRDYMRSKKIELERISIERAIQERGIKMLNTENGNILNNLFSDVVKKGVHLDDEKRIIWPVVLLYPEYRTSDIIELFHEDNTFEEQFEKVFSETPEWDTKGAYRVGNLNIYYEDSLAVIHQVEPTDTLGSVLSRDSYFIDAATPSFILMPKDSKDNNNKLIEGRLHSFQ